MTVSINKKMSHLLAAMSCGGILLLGCNREPSAHVARWVHCRALEDAETNGVRLVMAADADDVKRENRRIELKMSSKERDESRPRISNVLSELEAFTAPKCTNALVDDFTAAHAQHGFGRDEIVNAFGSVRYIVKLGVVPLVTVEIHSPNAELALAAMEFWSVAFQKSVNDRYAHKHELTVKWVEAECKKAENCGCRDIGLIRQNYMRGVKDMRRTLRQLHFYTVEPPHIVE